MYKYRIKSYVCHDKELNKISPFAPYSDIIDCLTELSHAIMQDNKMRFKVSYTATEPKKTFNKALMDSEINDFRNKYKCNVFSDHINKQVFYYEFHVLEVYNTILDTTTNYFSFIDEIR